MKPTIEDLLQKKMENAESFSFSEQMKSNLWDEISQLNTAPANSGNSNADPSNINSSNINTASSSVQSASSSAATSSIATQSATLSAKIVSSFAGFKAIIISTTAILSITVAVVVNIQHSSDDSATQEIHKESIISTGEEVSTNENDVTEVILLEAENESPQTINKENISQPVEAIKTPSATGQANEVNQEDVAPVLDKQINTASTNGETKIDQTETERSATIPNTIEPEIEIIQQTEAQTQSPELPATASKIETQPSVEAIDNSAEKDIFTAEEIESEETDTVIVKRSHVQNKTEIKVTKVRGKPARGKGGRRAKNKQD